MMLEAVMTGRVEWAESRADESCNADFFGRQFQALSRAPAIPE